MAYIGSTPPSRFVSNRAVTQFSGDGSEDEFTLEQVVAQDEDILVSVDGVIQEPSVAYAVSSGTTLTFDDPPSSNAGNNIFVYYLASQVGTIGHPSTRGLSATTGTFSGNATVAGTLGVTGNATLAGTIAVTGTSTLTGVTALGNTGSTVKSEGGAVTTNIAQGLAKAWQLSDGTAGSVSLGDSLNHSGIVDNGTGDYTCTYTNNMASTNYTQAWQQLNDVATGGETNLGGLRSSNGVPTLKSTSQYRSLSQDLGTAVEDHVDFGCMVMGDLA